LVDSLKVLIRELTTKLILTVELNDTSPRAPLPQHTSQFPLRTTHFAVGHSICSQPASQPASQLTKALHFITLSRALH